MLLARQSRRVETAMVEGFGGTARAPEVRNGWKRVNELLELLQVESVKEYYAMGGGKGEDCLGKEEVLKIVRMRADFKADANKNG